MIKRIFYISISFLLIFVNIVFANSNSKDDEVNEFQITREDVRKQLIKECVSEKDVDKLMLKLDNGELWDSMKSEYKDLKPQINTPKYKKTIYPDGSFKIEEVKDLTTTSTKNMVPINGYRASLNLGVLYMSFDVDAIRDTYARRARIDRQYNKNVGVFLGTYSEDAYGHDNGWQQEAHAWYAINYNGYSDMAASRYWVRAHVDGRSIWTEKNAGF